MKSPVTGSAERSSLGTQMLSIGLPSHALQKLVGFRPSSLYAQILWALFTLPLPGTLAVALSYRFYHGRSFRPRHCTSPEGKEVLFLFPQFFFAFILSHVCSKTCSASPPAKEPTFFPLSSYV